MEAGTQNRAAGVGVMGLGALAHRGPVAGADGGLEGAGQQAAGTAREGVGTVGRAQGAGGSGAAVVEMAVGVMAAVREVVERVVGMVGVGARRGPGIGARAVGRRWDCSGRWSGRPLQRWACLQGVGRNNGKG